MPAYVFNGGAWRGADRAWVFNGGAWREAYQIYVYSGANGWRGVWSYAWNISAWGACSAGCGGGTQYRSISCVNNRGATVDNWKCQWYTGYTPATSQGCNTQACAECKWADPGWTGDAYFYRYSIEFNQVAAMWGKNNYVVVNQRTAPTTHYVGGCKYWPGSLVSTEEKCNHHESGVDCETLSMYYICRCCPDC